MSYDDALENARDYLTRAMDALRPHVGTEMPNATVATYSEDLYDEIAKARQTVSAIQEHLRYLPSPPKAERSEPAEWPDAGAPVQSWFDRP